MPIQSYSALLPGRSGTVFTGRREWTDSSNRQIFPHYSLVWKALVVWRVTFHPPRGSPTPCVVLGSPGQGCIDNTPQVVPPFQLPSPLPPHPSVTPGGTCTQSTWALATCKDYESRNVDSVNYTPSMLSTNSPSSQLEQEASALCLSNWWNGTHSLGRCSVDVSPTSSPGTGSRLWIKNTLMPPCLPTGMDEALWARAVWSNRELSLTEWSKA